MNPGTILVFIFIFVLKLQSTKCKNAEITSSDECQIWFDKHLIFTNDYEYTGSVVYKLKFNSLKELNINCSLESKKNISILSLNPIPFKRILLGYDFNIQNILTAFNFLNAIVITMNQLKGFNLKPTTKLDNKIQFLSIVDSENAKLH